MSYYFYQPPVLQQQAETDQARKNTQTARNNAPLVPPGPIMQAVYENQVLAQGPGTVQDKPVLTQGNSVVRNAPVLDQAVQAPFYPTPDGTLPQLPQQPQQKPGFGDRLMRYMAAQEARGETPVSQKLIAMGAAMQGNSHLGRNPAMAAMGQAYNDISNTDQIRQQAVYEKQMETYEDNKEYLDKLDATDRQYTDALAKFDQFGNTVTGIVDSRVTSAWDNLGFGDPQREAFRVELKQLIVDNTLLNTAQTKGAISDREMALFKSGVPSMNASEEVWKSWIKARQANLREIRKRIAGGITVERGADIGFENSYTVASNDQGSQASQPPQRTYTQEEDDALFEF